MKTGKMTTKRTQRIRSAEASGTPKREELTGSQRKRVQAPALTTQKPSKNQSEAV